MLTINTNTTSLITQMNLSRSNNLVQKSIERLSTGFKINNAKDDAANTSISKKMSCQISGTAVALDNAQQAMNLLQTADGALDVMQDSLQRIRELSLAASNGTYSAEEKAMLQQEINQRVQELFKQKNSTTYNKITIFGEAEEVPVTPTVQHITEAEAIAAGYECIKSEADFMKIKDNTSGKYCLMCDIDFSKISGWGDVTLTGELNGNGYSVNNLTINSTINTDMHGLFRYNNGTIKNLSMNNVNIESTNEKIGGLVGWNTNTIENCSVSGSIKGGHYTGGLVGTNNKIITNSSSSGSITGTGSCTGGLVGASTSGTVTNCSSSGTVTGIYSTAGLVGWNTHGTITNCSSSGTVTGKLIAGGIVGYNGNGTITNCSSSGSVTGNENTGGIVGICSEGGTIDKSYSIGDVSGTNYVGGLAGCNATATILNSYALGNVSGNDYVGGLTGKNDRPISTSYSTGTVTGTGSNVGGFVGSGGTTENCYTTSDENFYGSGTTATGCHGTTAQDGVTAHDSSWFKDGTNLTFLGNAYDTRYNPPDLKENSRGERLPVNITFQIGANSGEENTLTIDTGFSLGNYNPDVTTLEGAQKAVDDTDGLLKGISTFRSEIGAMQNRIESVMDSLSTRKNNLEASHSTIVDTDFALESSKLVQQQILQNATSSLLAQSNLSPEIALKLLS